jgi:hypothetical protein
MSVHRKDAKSTKVPEERYGTFISFEKSDSGFSERKLLRVSLCSCVFAVRVCCSFTGIGLRPEGGFPAADALSVLCEEGFRRCRRRSDR